MHLDGQAPKSAGYAMAGLLAAIAIMAILASVAMPTWRQAAQREREEELIFRGRQYARAVELFQRKFANAFPPNFDVLYEQHFLRKKYKDPMVEDGEFQVLYQVDMRPMPGGRGGGAAGRGAAQTSEGRGQGVPGVDTSSSQAGAAGQPGTSGPRGGVIGVVSKSKDKSIRLYNGRNYYNEWQFVYTPLTVGPGGVPGVQRPGQGPRGGGPGGAGGMGGGRDQGGRGGERGQRGMGPGGFGPGMGGSMGPQRGPG
jgi:type II secretory pathway pseudopilin PulG